MVPKVGTEAPTGPTLAYRRTYVVPLPPLFHGVGADESA